MCKQISSIPIKNEITFKLFNYKSYMYIYLNVCKQMTNVKLLLLYRNTWNKKFSLSPFLLCLSLSLLSFCVSPSLSFPFVSLPLFPFLLCLSLSFLSFCVSPSLSFPFVSLPLFPFLLCLSLSFLSFCVSPSLSFPFVSLPLFPFLLCLSLSFLSFCVSPSLSFPLLSLSLLCFLSLSQDCDKWQKPYFEN